MFEWEGVCGARGGSRKSLETVVADVVADVSRSWVCIGEALPI